MFNLKQYCVLTGLLAVSLCSNTFANESDLSDSFKQYNITPIDSEHIITEQVNEAIGRLGNLASRTFGKDVVGHRFIKYYEKLRFKNLNLYTNIDINSEALSDLEEPIEYISSLDDEKKYWESQKSHLQKFLKSNKTEFKKKQDILMLGISGQDLTDYPMPLGQDAFQLYKYSLSSMSSGAYDVYMNDVLNEMVRIDHAMDKYAAKKLEESKKQSKYNSKYRNRKAKTQKDKTEKFDLQKFVKENLIVRDPELNFPISSLFTNTVITDNYLATEIDLKSVLELGLSISEGYILIKGEELEEEQIEEIQSQQVVASAILGMLSSKMHIHYGVAYNEDQDNIKELWLISYDDEEDKYLDDKDTSVIFEKALQNIIK